MSAGKWFLFTIIAINVVLAFAAQFSGDYDRAAYLMSVAIFMVVCERR